MKITVIVATYNSHEPLKKVLDGLLNQSRLPDQVIVADDGSGHLTRRLVETYLGHALVDIRHVWQEDEGFRLARIRNLAVAQSTGSYLIFLDGDCIPGRHFIKDHLELAEKGFFFQGKRVIVSRKATPSFSFYDTVSKRKLLKMILKGALSNSHHLLRLPFLPPYSTVKLSGVRGCNMAMFKEDLLAVNGFNQDFTGWGREDSELVARFYKYGLKRREHPFRAICYHLWHPENSRDTISENDHILEQVLKGDSYICENGIRQNE